MTIYLYYWRRGLLTALLIAYPILAIAGPYQGRAEFYPFFSWNLFSRSLNGSIGDAVIVVREIDGKPLPKPTMFFELDQHFSAARRKDIRLGKMLDNLVRAESAGNSALSQELFRVIEHNFMKEATSVKYDVAVIHYNPIQRYRHGDIDAVVVVKSGEKRP